MLFKINAKAFLEYLHSPDVVSSTNTIKDHPTVNLVSLHATDDFLNLYGNGGRVGIRSQVPFMGAYCTDYLCAQAGRATINIKDLIKVLSSFHPNEILEVKKKDNSDGEEVVITQTSDKENHQTLPCVNVVFAEPKQSIDTYEIQINKEAFLRGIGRVLFAGGFEESRPKYLYWVLRLTSKGIRFIAGTGARFAIFDMHGDNLHSAEEDINITLPVEISGVIQKVIKNCSAEYVKITYSDSDKQYSLECDNIFMSVVGFDPPINWINEEDILSRENSHRIVCSFDNWKLAANGIIATNNDEEKEQTKRSSKIHNTYLKLDSKSNTIVLSATGSMRAKRKIPLSDIKSNDEDLDFCCNTKYIEEIFKNADSSPNLQFEFQGGEKPLIVRFFADLKVQDVLESVNDLSKVKEKFSMFIVRSNDKG